MSRKQRGVDTVHRFQLTYGIHDTYVGIFAKPPPPSVSIKTPKNSKTFKNPITSSTLQELTQNTTSKCAIRKIPEQRRTYTMTFCWASLQPGAPACRHRCLRSSEEISADAPAAARRGGRRQQQTRWRHAEVRDTGLLGPAGNQALPRLQALHAKAGTIRRRRRLCPRGEKCE